MIESSEVQDAAQAIGQRIIVSKAGSELDLVPAFTGTPAALLIAGSPFFYTAARSTCRVGGAARGTHSLRVA